jgi:hypothetical protein
MKKIVIPLPDKDFGTTEVAVPRKLFYRSIILAAVYLQLINMVT